MIEGVREPVEFLNALRIKPGITRETVLLPPFHRSLLRSISRTAKTGRLVANRRVAVDTGKDSDGWRFVLPTRSPNDFHGSGVGALRILGRTFLVIPGIIPIVHPLPDIPDDVIDTERALSRFIASDRHQSLFTNPSLIKVEVFRRGLDVSPWKSSV